MMKSARDQYGATHGRCSIGRLKQKLCHMRQTRFTAKLFPYTVAKYPAEKHQQQAKQLKHPVQLHLHSAAISLK